MWQVAHIMLPPQSAEMPGTSCETATCMSDTPSSASIVLVQPSVRLHVTFIRTSIPYLWALRRRSQPETVRPLSTRAHHQRPYEREADVVGPFWFFGDVDFG